MAHDLFISYSHMDQAVADVICANLENAGARCWIAPRDIAPGLDWPTAISNAISASRIMVLVFSGSSNASMEVSRELILASNSKLIVIPFKIEAVQPEPGKQYYLARTHWLEAANPPTHEQIQALVGVVRSFLSGPEASRTVKPSPPVKLDRHNLPAQLTSFIGRTKEVAEVKAAAAEHRLVTLIGPGGTGKTRLALRTAADLLESFPDGVWFIELAPVTDPALVLKTIGSTLGARDEPDRPLLEIVKDYLRSKDVLLLLDNCEHLVETAAQVTAALLNACPKLHVLASSREALGIPGEIPYRVPPLSIPNPRSLPPLETLAGYEAVQLFVERAGAALPTFQLTGENSLAVAQICTRLDGIPLAIELAAARINLLTVEQIATRLDDTFRLLTGSSRTALPRQQTLRATIDWSYNLLSEPERVLLRWLTTFTGGWTLEAAETVCANPPGSGPAGPADILDLLNALVNKSLVMMERDQGKEARYRLLETIRQYAREKFSEAGETGPVRDRHLAYFLALSRRGEPELRGPAQAAWFDRFEAEHDNFRTALAWSLEGGADRAAQGLQMAVSLWWFWFMRGYTNEGAEWFDRLLAATRTSSDLLNRAKAVSRLGWLRFDRAILEEGAKLAQSLGPAGRESLAIVYWTIGAGAWYLADYSHAHEFEEKACRLFRELKIPWGMCESLTWWGMALVKEGDLRQAALVLEESLALARKAGDVNGIAFSLWQLGNATTAAGNYEQATRFLEEGLALYREVKQAQGIIWSVSSLGKAALEQRNYSQAVLRYREALALYWENGNERLIASGLEQLAYAARYEQAGQAATLMGAAEALRESSGAAQYPYERLDYETNLEALHAKLDEAAFTRCWAEGRAMKVKQAVTYALEEPLA